MLKKQQWDRWRREWDQSKELVILTKPPQIQTESEEEEKAASHRKNQNLFSQKT